jgi:hypothetical protein
MNPTDRFGKLYIVLVTVLVVALLLSVALLVDHGAWGDFVLTFLGKEPFKILLQFLLVTVLGGLTFALFDFRRDAAVRRDNRAAAIRALDDLLGKAYRQMKLSKRRLRSRLDRSDPALPSTSADAFREGMDELLATQIALEEVEDIVATRVDLFDEEVLKRLKGNLRYTARYLHDVFEDFEKARIVREGDVVIVGTDASNLRDFLIRSEFPRELENALKTLADEKQDFAERHAALTQINQARKVKPPGPGYGRRYGKVAYDAVRVTSAELKHLLGET